MTLFQKLPRSRQRKLQAKRSTGAVAVEFAICVPVLFTLLFGFYEVARANLMQHATESAAYEGARIGIIPGATEEEVRDATAFVLNSVGVRQFTVDVENNVNADDAEQVTVEINVPFEDNFRLGTFFLTVPSFNGQCTLTRETL